MKYIKGQPRNQMKLVTECLEDYISEENPVRVIDAFVDNFDLDLAGFLRTMPKETGRPPYDPRDLLKLYVYGYFNKSHQYDGSQETDCCNVGWVSP